MKCPQPSQAILQFHGTILTAEHAQDLLTYICTKISVIEILSYLRFTRKHGLHLHLHKSHLDLSDMV